MALRATTLGPALGLRPKSPLFFRAPGGAWGRRSLPQKTLFLPMWRLRRHIGRKNEKGVAMPATHHAVGGARIGPNSLIQTVGALEEQHGTQEAHRLLELMGHGELATQLPTTMVDEQEFIGLISALRGELGIAGAGKVLARAGERTAEYLLANRIPAPARFILPLMPRRLALPIFLKAIAGHAWTFAGSGRFSFMVERHGATLRLADCPEARGISADVPVCSFYTACFQALLRPLIDRKLTVRERSCAAQGVEGCSFDVTLGK
ncbi:MAG: bacteriochlorophyll 4-vinyl reductase [Candidatus Viridilinea halotolerans]|uniref:Bacteriochlorophyll 4-vinyl reductase n=1 Tax=Candidatus Viridilinea halotolerans TaxID=2491704 RepID=A0A426U639_9CHLR|nr:MAG: bacteriochlorophyll 4-vinyl reductase [Candidatus Viridilinea halotolerans]